MKKIRIKDFLASKKTRLDDIPTEIDLGVKDNEVEWNMIQVREKLGELQNTMYAHGKYAVLVCLQGIDTAGKDSMIREIFKDFNTTGIKTYSFKKPTEWERKHDYLWRHFIALPKRGTFGIFNRTHYENVIVSRVHPQILLNEFLPHINDVNDIDEAFWDQRYRQINDFERYLHENGIIIFKFFLHLSKEEQRKRLLRRLYKRHKNWKFSSSDIAEREKWVEYRKYYNLAIQRTHKKHAPWYVIPADNKDVARYIVSRILWDTLKKYKDIKEPEPSDEVKEHLDKYIKQLEAENR